MSHIFSIRLRSERQLCVDFPKRHAIIHIFTQSNEATHARGPLASFACSSGPAFVIRLWCAARDRGLLRAVMPCNSNVITKNRSAAIPHFHIVPNTPRDLVAVTFHPSLVRLSRDVPFTSPVPRQLRQSLCTSAYVRNCRSWQ